MQLTFCGADLEVTGSCHLLSIGDKNYLIDCGLFQGGQFIEDLNWRPFPFDSKALKAVIVTHAHLDHVGRLPKLIKEGYDGPIYATPATAELARLVLLDAVEVMRYASKKNDVPMLFEERDVNETIRHFRTLDYEKTLRMEHDVHLKFKDAGHILGSAFVKIEAEGKIMVFSGDIGNSHVPIVRETRPLGQADYLLLESTYGSIIHESPADRIYFLQEAIVKTMKRGGVLMIPSFSLERTQEVLYELNCLAENKMIPAVPIYLDSPLAASATDVYKKYPQYFDEAAKYLLGRGDDFFAFPGLQITRDAVESKAINDVPAPKIIIAGSGMMNGGRILHHLLRYLPDSKSCLLVISYQSAGTLGRRLHDGAKKVRIYGQEVAVRAEIKSIGSYSAHGDQNKLTEWVKSAKRLPKKVFLVHGEPEAEKALEKRLKKDLGAKVTIASYGLTVKI